jgi:hypothetical protein
MIRCDSVGERWRDGEMWMCLAYVELDLRDLRTLEGQGFEGVADFD